MRRTDERSVMALSIRVPTVMGHACLNFHSCQGFTRGFLLVCAQ